MSDRSEESGENNGNLSRNSRSINESQEADDHCQGASSAQVGPDIGLGDRTIPIRRPTEPLGSSGSTSSSDFPRREENPFSFKHFLNRDTSGGARPKVFPTKLTSSPRLINNPELTSGLPDFVQDHLVIEQCYLNQPSQPLSVDMNRLAEFGLESSDDSWNPRRGGDRSFDLSTSRQERPSEPPPVLPLDLPERSTMPFDLPAQHPSGEVGVSTSLPDFLSDGPIHSGRRSESAHPSEPSSPVIPNQHSLVQSLQIENERLKREKEVIRRQHIDQVRRNEFLEGELRAVRNRGNEGASGIENAMQQLEDNLSRAIKRAESAELRASKLKQEVQYLSMKLSELQGACGPSNDQTSDRHLASQLRAAVSSAEHSLRQMLSGVDTLRIIASTLEHRNRFEDQPEFSETENRDESGPAL